MKVESYKNELLRYQVESEHGKPPYFVDLLEFDGKSFCDCSDFMCWTYPYYSGTKTLEQTIKDLPPARRKNWKPGCKHITRAREFFAEEIIKKIIIQQKSSKNLSA